MKPDWISLKFGSLKSYRLKSQEANEAVEKFYNAKAPSLRVVSSTDVRLSQEQKDALCEVIDLAQCNEVLLEWDDKFVSKEEAKAYVRAYGDEPAKV